MLTYGLQYKKDTESVDSKVLKSKTGRPMLLWKCVNKKSRFKKEQEANRLWSSLVIKTPLNKIPLLGDIVFNSVVFKMNEIVNTFLLAGLHLSLKFI